MGLKFLKLTWTFLDLKINCLNLIMKSEKNQSKKNLVVNAWYHAIFSSKLLCNSSEKTTEMS